MSSRSGSRWRFRHDRRQSEQRQQRLSSNLPGSLHSRANALLLEGEVQWLWTFRVAVVLGGRGVDANLRILQVIGPPESRFPTWFSSPLAPAVCPSGFRASNRYRRVVGRS
ncbi:hypothetical protein Taro_042252 [Colocasia esculenta]|uniref:Uncharacterized protein n=1 Tax=Colocasia esculenta TaxID=4460 RepID=A0A843WNH8_COLES|nr:hypothetical protein [Colocasia esculenta]